MSYLESLLLGILQGITEFLPVSSSGHLVIMRQFLNLKEIPVLFDVLLHISTLIVIVIVFRGRIASICLSVFKSLQPRKAADQKTSDRENLKLLLYIVIASAVTAAVGLIMTKADDFILGHPKIVCILFLVTAVILIVSRFFPGRHAYMEMGITAALVIGFAQGLGVAPGISRAGITISVALICGLNREKAGEFSFLIAIPAMLGALLITLNQAGALLEKVNIAVLAAGLISSFIAGLVFLLLLLKIVKKGKLYLFSFYLVPLALITFFLI